MGVDRIKDKYKEKRFRDIEVHVRVKEGRNSR